MAKAQLPPGIVQLEYDFGGCCRCVSTFDVRMVHAVKAGVWSGSAIHFSDGAILKVPMERRVISGHLTRARKALRAAATPNGKG